MAMEEVKRKRKMRYNVEQLIADRVREAQEQEKCVMLTSRYNCKYLQIAVP